MARCWGLQALLALLSICCVSGLTSEAPALISSRPGNVHTLLLTDCAKYQDWQTVAGAYAWRESGMSGAFTRVANCNEKDRASYPKAMLDYVDTHMAPEAAYNKELKDWYAAYNKPSAVLDWLAKNPSPKAEWIYLIDADMLVRRPVVPEEFNLTRGWAVAAHYDYMKGVHNDLATRHVPEIEPRNDTIAGPVGRRGDVVGAPYFMHMDDIRRVAPLWYNYTVKVRNDTQAWKDSGDTAARKGERIWIAEMYGYTFGAAKAGVWHRWSEDFMLYPGYTPPVIPRNIHYGLLYHIDKWSFDKHWYFKFDIHKCPPWNLDVAKPQEGIFPPPPHPATLKSKDYLHEYRDLIAVQALALINAAICDYHVRNCPPSQQLKEVCGNATQLYADVKKQLAYIESIWDCVDHNNECESWAKRGECTKSERYMQEHCRPSCNYCEAKSHYIPKTERDKAAKEARANQASPAPAAGEPHAVPAAAAAAGAAASPAADAVADAAVAAAAMAAATPAASPAATKAAEAGSPAATDTTTAAASSPAALDATAAAASPAASDAAAPTRPSAPSSPAAAEASPAAAEPAASGQTTAAAASPAAAEASPAAAAASAAPAASPASTTTANEQASAAKEAAQEGAPEGQEAAASTAPQASAAVPAESTAAAPQQSTAATKDAHAAQPAAQASPATMVSPSASPVTLAAATAGDKAEEGEEQEEEEKEDEQEYEQKTDEELEAVKKIDAAREGSNAAGAGAADGGDAVATPTSTKSDRAASAEQVSKVEGKGAGDKGAGGAAAGDTGAGDTGAGDKGATVGDLLDQAKEPQKDEVKQILERELGQQLPNQQLPAPQLPAQQPQPQIPTIPGDSTLHKELVARCALLKDLTHMQDCLKAAERGQQYEGEYKPLIEPIRDEPPNPARLQKKNETTAEHAAHLVQKRLADIHSLFHTQGRGGFDNILTGAKASPGVVRVEVVVVVLVVVVCSVWAYRRNPRFRWFLTWWRHTKDAHLSE